MSADKRDVTKQNIEKGKSMMPTFPSTEHWSYTDDPKIHWLIQEKFDGANMGMAVIDGEIFLRNREHILRKGYTKNTPAKQQFVPAWNFAHQKKKALEKLNRDFGTPVVVYGEWCYALHGVKYDLLEEFFIAFDIYIPEKKVFARPEQAEFALNLRGFITSPIIYEGPVNFEMLNQMSQQTALFTRSDLREGLVLKQAVECPAEYSFGSLRKKFVRQGYVQGVNWSETELVKQELFGLRTPKKEDIVFKPIREDSDVLTYKDFQECVDSGMFIDYDGHGYYATATEESNHSLVPSNFVQDKRFTHVVWYNR